MNFANLEARGPGRCNCSSLFPSGSLDAVTAFSFPDDQLRRVARSFLYYYYVSYTCDSEGNLISNLCRGSCRSSFSSANKHRRQEPSFPPQRCTRKCCASVQSINPSDSSLSNSLPGYLLHNRLFLTSLLLQCYLSIDLMTSSLCGVLCLESSCPAWPCLTHPWQIPA